MEPYISDVYKSQDGRHLLHNLYRKYLMAIHVPVRERMIETRFGDTHVMLYGNPDGKPLLTFYGEVGFNPLAVYPFMSLLDLDKIQLIVPDPVGQIGFSDERRLSFSKNEYSEWAIQLMNGLELQTVSVFGYSFGGNIALQLCTNASLRIERLLLMMPGGITGVAKYKRSKLMKWASPQKEKEITNKAIVDTLQPILIFRQDDLIEAAQMIFRHAKIDKINLKTIKQKAIRKFRSPVYVVAEKSDYLFPGEIVLKQARELFPRLEGARLLQSGCHCGLYDTANENDDLKEACMAINDFILRTF